jgi:hypothetical protein
MFQAIYMKEAFALPSSVQGETDLHVSFGSHVVPQFPGSPRRGSVMTDMMGCMSSARLSAVLLLP